MRPPSFSPVRSVVFVVVLQVFSALPLPAEPVLELDFRNFNEAARSVVPVRTLHDAAPAFFLSANDALVDPNAETGIVSANPALKNGFLETWSGSTGGGFLSSVQSQINQPDGAYAKYFGTDGFGSGTIVAVFQPKFSGPLNGTSPTQRACLFANNFTGTSEVGVSLIIVRDLALVLGLGNTSPPPQKVALEQPNWDPGKWYFIAASWTPGMAPMIYLREIGGGPAVFAQAENPLVNPSGASARNLVLGNAGSASNEKGGTTPMNGRMAYFQISDSALTGQAEFDALYNALLNPPAPAKKK